MKRNHLWMSVVVIAIFVMSLPMAAQNRSMNGDSSDDPDPLLYFELGDMPDLLKWLPAPPDTIGEAFAHDIMRYFWGKTQRLNPERANIAIRDAIFNMSGVCEAFSVPFGLEISEEGTPEIYKLLERGLNTIDLICLIPKEYYMRKRPFMRMHEPTLTPEDELALSLDGSYPSAHAIRGWGAALLMTEINPAAADTLLARGLMYGESRVVVGAHWQSDVDAGRLAASAAYAKLHTSEAFMRQMAKAQDEFRKLKDTNQLESIAPVTSGKSAREYTLSGTPATPQMRGIIISDNQKILRK